MRRPTPCETPKSPPGDYNWAELLVSQRVLYQPRVKHLNPRQGITTKILQIGVLIFHRGGVKHLNPRQGITTEEVRRSRAYAAYLGV